LALAVLTMLIASDTAIPLTRALEGRYVDRSRGDGGHDAERATLATGARGQSYWTMKQGMVISRRSPTDLLRRPPRSVVVRFPSQPTRL
jgi:hypothetical protein